MLVILSLVLFFSAARASVPAAFFFGASVFDTGNYGALDKSSFVNFPPYGFRLGQPTGRLSDGFLVSDFILQRLNISDVTPIFKNGGLNFTGLNFTHGANFAFAGAKIAPKMDAERGTSLSQQLHFFNNLKSLASPGLTQNAIEKGIYFLSIGLDDAIDWAIPEIQTQYGNSLSNYSQILANGLRSFVWQLYKQGGRKFVVMLIWPMECSPQARNNFNLINSVCLPFGSQVIRAINNAFTRTVRDLRLLPNVTIVLTKPDFFRKIIERPRSHGFDVGSIACCGSGPFNAGGDCGVGNFTVCPNSKRYVFWDYIHLTERANALFVDRIWRGGDSVVSNINLRRLASMP